MLVAVVAFVAAWLAIMPGVAFWDTGELQAVGPLMGTAHPTGFPTYVLLGWLASVLLQPFGEPAFRMNIFSAICLAVAAGVTVDLVRALTGWIALGVAAGIAMALTPIAWAIGDARRGALAPPGPRGDPALAARGVGRAGQAGRRGGAGRGRRATRTTHRRPPARAMTRHRPTPTRRRPPPPAVATAT